MPYRPEPSDPRRASGRTSGWRRYGGLLVAAVLGVTLVVVVSRLVGGGGPAGPVGDGETLRLQGSNTIGAELAPALAEAFLAGKGAMDVQKVEAAGTTTVSGTLPGADDPTRFEIGAEGTGSALTGLAEGTADIGMASRRLSAQEATDLASRGELLSRRSEFVIGLDAVAVILRAETGVVALSVDQLRGIFTCEITDWAALGAPPGPIRVLARDENAGSFAVFRDAVLGDRPLCPAAERFTDSQALSQAVAQDPLAIGFVGRTFANNNRVVEIYDGSSVPTGPDLLSVSTESYLLTRRLYLYLPALPGDNALAREFVEGFVLSERGQRIVEANQFVSTLYPPPAPPAPPCPATAPPEYCAAVGGASRVPFDVRFATGTDQLDNRAFRNLDLFAAPLTGPAGAGKRVLLVGFADNAGTDESNLALSRQRAESVRAYLTGLGVTAVVDPVGFGEALPVAGNETEQGREQNRRVEVWVR